MVHLVAGSPQREVIIAQSCLDHDIPLITYDLDFRHFIPAGLKLL